MEDLGAAVSRWLANPIILEDQVFNGDEAEVWRASSASGRYVVHVSAPWRSPDELAWCHNIAIDAAHVIEEVVAPITCRGESFFDWHGRLVAVFPFVEGRSLDREDESEVTQAARLLAAIHGTLLRSDGRDRPAAGEQPIAAIEDLRDLKLDRAWATVAPELTRGVCHGDYYRRNLLVADGVIRGVIDWHDAYVGPLVAEAAFAAWEFGHDEDMRLVRSRFDLFIHEYRRAAHVPTWEYAVVPTAVRVKLRENIIWAINHGAHIDDEYQRLQARAFWELKPLLA